MFLNCKGGVKGSKRVTDKSVSPELTKLKKLVWQSSRLAPLVVEVAAVISLLPSPHQYGPNMPQSPTILKIRSLNITLPGPSWR